MGKRRGADGPVGETGWVVPGPWDSCVFLSSSLTNPDGSLIHCSQQRWIFTGMEFEKPMKLKSCCMTVKH